MANTIVIEKKEITQKDALIWRAGMISDSGATERVKKLNQQFHSHLPSLCLERARIYTRVMGETEGEPMIIRRAKCFKATCEEKTVYIEPYELLVGSEGGKPRAKTIYPEWCGWLRNEVNTIDQRDQDPYQISAADKKELKEKILPFWENRYTIRDAWLKRCPQDVVSRVQGNNFAEMGILTTNSLAHFLPPYTYLFQEGFKGLKKIAEEKLEGLDLTIVKNTTKRYFYQAAIIVSDAIIVYAKRYSEEAKKQAEKTKDAKRKKELLKIAEVCARVPENSPRDFWEAVQFFLFVQIVAHIECTGPSISPGRFDQYMYPLYKKDIENGKITRNDALELLECCWIKLTEIMWLMDKTCAKYFAGYNPFMNLVVGGQLPNGKDGTNDITYLVLEAIMDTRTTQPGISVKHWANTPHELRKKSAELSRLGLGYPSNYTDEVGVKMCLRRGYSLEDAKNWAPIGCVEPGVEGMQCGLTNCGQLNLGGVIELSMTNGIQRLSGKKIGTETGNPNNFLSFDEFKSACKKQISFLVRQLAIADNLAETLHKELAPHPFQSILTFGCLDEGKDVTEGGARINAAPTFVAIGLADLANSLAAIKQFVYDNQSISMKELCKACEVNFEGNYEVLRQRLLTEVPKYGNNDDYVDQFAVEFAEYFVKEVEQYTGPRGNKFSAGIIPVTTYIVQGTSVGALPEGRKSGAPLADGCSPVQGSDRSPTQAILSETKIKHEQFADGTLTNMWINSNYLESDEQLEKLMALLRTFQELGGFHLQFNTIDKKILHEAQKHPEKHPSLMVRVAGYSAYFVDLHKDVQDAIISRTEHMI